MFVAGTAAAAPGDSLTLACIIVFVDFLLVLRAFLAAMCSAERSLRLMHAYFMVWASVSPPCYLCVAELHEMGRKADVEKAQAASNEKAMTGIEAKAAKQYQRDLEALRAVSGQWEWDEGSNLYYNERHAYYHDAKTGYYYGGSEPQWTLAPAIPSEALFGTAPHKGGPKTCSTSRPQSTGAAPAASKAAAAGAAAAAAGPVTSSVVRRVVALPKHPQSNVGGYQMPQEGGRIGAAKGVGMQGMVSGSSAGKRRREEAAAAAGSKGKALSKEDQEALARREAAKQRVTQRALSNFGMSR